MTRPEGAAAGPLQAKGGAVGLALPAGVRLVFFHKQRTSARLRFLLFAWGIAVPHGTGPDAVLQAAPGGAKVVPHPAMIAAECTRHFDLPRGAIGIDGDFRLYGEAGGEPFTLLLAEFLGIDPPFEQAAARGGRFVSLIEARGLESAERQALRIAYAHILS